MNDTLNQIDEIIKRSGASYSDAKEALENSNGDILEALLYLEKNNKSKNSNTRCNKPGFWDKVSRMIKRGSEIRFIMHKEGKTILNLSLNIAILITLLALPFLQFIGIAFLIALFTGHRFKLESCSGNTDKINEGLDRVSDAVDDIKEGICN